MIFIALIAVLSLAAAYYLTYREDFALQRTLNDGDKGMIIGFQ